MLNDTHRSGNNKGVSCRKRDGSNPATCALSTDVARTLCADFKSGRKTRPNHYNYIPFLHSKRKLQKASKCVAKILQTTNKKTKTPTRVQLRTTTPFTAMTETLMAKVPLTTTTIVNTIIMAQLFSISIPRPPPASPTCNEIKFQLLIPD